MKKSEFIILTIALIGACLVGAIWAWRGDETKTVQINSQSQENLNQITKNQDNDIDAIDWKTYRDDKYKFEIKYNPEWEIKNYGTNALGGESLFFFVPENESVYAYVSRSFSRDDPKKWFYEKFSPAVDDYKVTDKAYTINDYPAYYIQEVYDGVYTMNNYAISNGSSIIYFHFKLISNELNSESGKIEEVRYDKYLPEFEEVVKSINFVE